MLGEDELVEESRREGEHDGVRRVDHHRGATRRQADEDARDERVEEDRSEKELAVHCFITTYDIFPRAHYK